MAGNHKTKYQARCDRAASDALLDAALAGYPHLNAGHPLAQRFSRTHSSDQLKADLAARQIEHALVAWHYLSQAAVALLNNQESIAVHLAYYAEVRSANSLLASTGISNKEHTSHYINGALSLVELEVPTHELIRRIWPKWYGRVDASHAFTSLTVAPSVTLGDIGEALGIHNIQSSSLQKWSFELLMMTGDHKARNTASYDVTKVFNTIPTIDFKRNAALLQLVWDHLQPANKPGQCRFEIYYAQFLVWGQCTDYAQQQDGSVDAARFHFRFKQILSTLSGNTGATEEMLTSTLQTPLQRPESFRLFDLAGATKSDPENVMARAAILCRLSSNKLNTNIQLTRCVPALEWINKWLVEACIIQDHQDPFDEAMDFGSCEDATNRICALDGYSIWRDDAYSAHKSSRLDNSLCWVLDYEFS